MRKLAREAKLQALWGGERPGEMDYFVEVLNARDGTAVGGAVVHTGKYSFMPQNLHAPGDWTIVTDNLNRVLLYSSSTGEGKANWFGYNPQISPKASEINIGGIARAVVIAVTLSRSRAGADKSRG